MHSTAGEVKIHYKRGCKCHRTTGLKFLEREKSVAIKDNNGNNEAFMSLSSDAKTELEWWIKNIKNSFIVISHDPPSLTISTDASKIGWGGVDVWGSLDTPRS